MTTREARIDSILKPLRSACDSAVERWDRARAIHDLDIARTRLHALSDDALAAEFSARSDGVVERFDSDTASSAELEQVRARAIEAKRQLALPMHERKDVKSWHAEQNWQERYRSAQAEGMARAGTTQQARTDPAVDRARARRDVANLLASR